MGRRRVILVAAGAVLILGSAAWFIVWLLTDTVSHRLDIPDYTVSYMAVEGSEPWKPGQEEGQGFARAAENDRFRLSVHPDNGQMKVMDKKQGVKWSSNPSPEQVKTEKVAGTLRTNMESPFILEYFEQSKIQRQVMNGLDPSVKRTITKLEQGVAVHYDIAKVNLSFSMYYVLTDDGLEVSIPAKSIKESGPYRILSIESLPFFGAATGEESGYLFVPDGPGGLIHFPLQKELVGKGYNQEVYGPEITNRISDSDNSNEVVMPVFGMKKGDQAFLAVISAGEKSSIIRALPAGIVSSLNSVHAKFVYRQEYDRRLSLGGRSIRVFQEDPLLQDRTVRYLFLEKEDAGYVGMAKRYRQYLTDTGQVPQGPQPSVGGLVPLDLTLIGGDSNDYGDYRYERATTFKQAEEIVTELKKAGIDSMRITYKGWESKGTINPDKRFSPESKLGGGKGLRAFVEKAHGLGYEVDLAVDLVKANPTFSKLPPKSYGIRGVEEDVLLRNDQYYLNPGITYNLAMDMIRDAKEYGIDGMRFSGLGGLLFNDYNPAYNYTREDTAYLYENIQKRAQEVLGHSSVLTGNLYSLKYTGEIHTLISDPSYSYAVDETVPFYPIVLHGSIPYSLTPGNMRDEDGREFLKAIEYGAIPSFVLTYESSRSLMDTFTWGIFSSKFVDWKDDVIREYKSFNKLASVQGEPITDHYRRSEGIYVTVYGNGVSVTVDYNRKEFHVGKEGDGA